MRKEKRSLLQSLQEAHQLIDCHADSSTKATTNEVRERGRGWRERKGLREREGGGRKRR